ncbi:metal-dependent hydrolase [Wenjunlia vitaminophila]|uniref:Metal-dependent hydrolase n=1 Tax=Wenjunlia vitaminophila TaxID=76728 RepID=A0A0T6LQY4_WENVI|nr:hypothetical protein [Wenjunlia vitaminophila]KRV48507.1 metal-dependent hydrolase [Wenjunlia vitaminophila]
MSVPTPTATTVVTFPAGSTRERSTVRSCHLLPDGRYGVVTEVTPFHPLDHTWPDQPGDTGTLADLTVEDCLTAARDDDHELLVGADIPVRRGDPDWTWHVLHVVAQDPAALVGTEVDLVVEPGRRAALSAAHTGCHLLALALNEALADRWRKPARTDALGNPDFDSLAMSSSRIGERASTDVYRLGKSLRKKGFTTEGLAEALPEITARVNGRLAAWVSSGAPVTIDTPGPELTAHRRWTCALPDGTASLSCGGTHIPSLGALSSLTTELTLNGDGTELTAVTTPKPST